MGLTHSSVIGAPIAEVFAWHERAGALARLLPPWLPVRIAQEAPSLTDGHAIIRLPGGVRWVAAHGGYDPPNRFVDELVSLPLTWRHVHSFTAESEATTRITDAVDTPVPSRWLRQTFRYRHRQLAEDLATHAEVARLRPAPLCVAVTGSSGIVGSALCALLTSGGHRVVRLVRRPAANDDEREWRPESPHAELLADIDAVAHLAGESIAGRFTEAHKQSIRESRVGPTSRLAETMARMREGPKVFVVASAIGYYGAAPADEELGEGSPSGHDFLARVVADWEAATHVATEAAIRVVNVRTGIVQTPRGGTLRLLRPLFEAGLGGRIGQGRQWTSWIDIDDLTDIYYRALVDDRFFGPMNAVAPEPITNRGYSDTLAHVLRRPAVLPAPELGVRLLLGRQGADELAMASQRVRPDRMVEVGYRFRHPTLEGSLRHLLGRLAP